MRISTGNFDSFFSLVVTPLLKDKILAFVCLMKNLLLYFSKKILVLIHYVYTL